MQASARRPTRLPPAPIPPADLVYEGDSHYGTTFILAQQHADIFSESTHLHFGVVKSQQRVLEMMCKLHPKNVFFEGCGQPWSSHDLSLEQRESLRQSFAGWQPGRPPTRYQAQLLQAPLGTARIYAALAPHVVVFHQTESAEIIEQVVTQIRAGQHLTAMGALILDGRDQFLKGALQRFFAMNPGEQAVVVLGAMHDLSCQRRADFNPSMRWYNCSRLPPSLLAAARDTLRHDGHHPRPRPADTAALR